MKRYRLLWVDDEIELLHPYILFLEEKGYDVDTTTNGIDAISRCQSVTYDLVLLDEHMPGITGLETLERLKECRPTTPVIMVTKSEEEHIMDMAIGRKIADYLIKPVNPNQILLSLKRNLHRQSIECEVSQGDYAEEFGRIGRQIAEARDSKSWEDLYRKIVKWELDFADTRHPMAEMLKQQKEEATEAFSKFVAHSYLSWIASYKRGEQENRPLLSPEIFPRKIFPMLDQGRKVFFLVMDNFRYDQWKMLVSKLPADFSIKESMYYSILPTTTQYARNSLFAGLMPGEIVRTFPELWIEDNGEEPKNKDEALLLEAMLRRYHRRESFSYRKLMDAGCIEQLMRDLPQLWKNELNVAVVNFIDMLSHGRTENKMIRELAKTEAAYRSITQSWFVHSALSDLLALLGGKGYTIVITTDHGSIRVTQPEKVVCHNNDTTNNLRYKISRNITHHSKRVYEIANPADAMLPCRSLSSRYVFAMGPTYLSYAQYFNLFARRYEDTFQHGGISLEEMIVPFVVLESERAGEEHDGKPFL